MPNQPIVFPANFATANAMAYTNPDGTAQLVSAVSALPVSGPLTEAQLRATPVSVGVDSVVDAAVTAGTATSAGVVVSASTAGFAGGAFHVISAGTTCTVAYEQSNDNLNWVSMPVISLAAANSAPALTTATSGIFGFASSAAFVRARVSTYTSGTVTIALSQKRISQPVNGISLAGGTSPIGTVTVTGTINTGTGYTDSVSALAAAAVFTGTGRAASAAQNAFFKASAYADQAGTLFIDQSLDTGATYFPVTSVAVPAATTGQLAVRLTGALTTATLYRVRYVNGAVAQTTFRLASAYSAV